MVFSFNTVFIVLTALSNQRQKLTAILVLCAGFIQQRLMLMATVILMIDSWVRRKKNTCHSLAVRRSYQRVEEDLSWNTVYTWCGRQKDMEHASQEFLRKVGLPNCQGAIDGTHLRLRQGPFGGNTSRDWYNRKGWYSVVLQAICDSNGIFLDISTGMPGCVHDSRVLTRSRFYDAAMAGAVLAEPVITINRGYHVSPYILGDQGYQMLPWLVKCYPPRGLSVLQRTFNERHIRGRLIIEQAFGQLKARFPILSLGIGSSITWGRKWYMIVAFCTIYLCSSLNEYSSLNAGI
ncbi:hypothetical protein R1sor_009355 [Riccia sorocarpa]|uniref:DDE Tnp4 domain-containing protein n=1 Tax=Riccia sorocarpa TaxID=122646 RepID=A0ABD3HY87_9MARC